MMADTHHPVDKGWAWVILIGVFFTQFIGIGYIRSYGLFFVAFQEKFDYTAGMLSVVSGVQFFSYCFTSLVVTNVLLKRYSVRTCGIIGVSLECVGIILSIFLPGSFGLLFSQGVIHGIGFGFIFFTGLLILSQYFRHRRYIATVIASCGAPVGGIVLPLITRSLLEYYGLHGALLLISGLFLNQLLFVILFTPPSEYDPIESQHVEELMGSESVEDTGLRTSLQDGGGMGTPDTNTTRDDIIELAHDMTSSRHSINIHERDPIVIPFDSKTAHNEGDISDNPDLCYVSSEVLERGSKSNRSSNHCEVRDFDVAVASTSDDSECQAEANAKTQLNTDDRIQKGGKLKIFGQPAKYQMSVPEIFHLRRFWLLVPGFMASAMALICTVLLPPLFKERGLSKTVAASLMSMTSAMDLVGRLIPGILLQLRVLSPTQLTAITFSGCCVVCALTRLYHEYVSLAIFAAVYGCIGNSIYAFQTLLVIDILGMKHLASAIGFYALVLGTSAGVSFPICGFLKTWTDTYSASFMYLAAMYLIGVVFLTLLLIERHRTQTTKLQKPDL